MEYSKSRWDTLEATLKELSEVNGGLSIQGGRAYLDDNTVLYLNEAHETLLSLKPLLKEARHMLVHLMEDWEESGHDHAEADQVVNDIDEITGYYDDEKEVAP